MFVKKPWAKVPRVTFIVYDSLGVPINVRVTATLESRTDEKTIYRWYADSPENQPLSGTGRRGRYRVAAVRRQRQLRQLPRMIESRSIVTVFPVSRRLQFNLDFGLVSGLATQDATLAATRQDGSEPGVLNSFVVGEDGTIRGVFSNGVTRDLGSNSTGSLRQPGRLGSTRFEHCSPKASTPVLPVQGAPG